MTRFCIYTRGRTGSTAIADELNKHPDITCHGEIFRPTPKHMAEAESQRTRAEAIDNGRRNGRPALYKEWTGEPLGEPPTPAGFEAYLSYLDEEARTTAVGWKIIAGNSGDGFLDLCQNNHVRVVNLRRRNIVRQVISGLVAGKITLFNKKGYSPQSERSFRFEPDVVLKKVNRAQTAYQKQHELLASHSVPSIAVYYEDWVQDRARFFAKVHGFLETEVLVVNKTDYSQMTPEPLDKLLSNYGRISRVLIDEGFGKFLDQD